MSFFLFFRGFFGIIFGILMSFASTHVLNPNDSYLKCVSQSQIKIGWMGEGIGFISEGNFFLLYRFIYYKVHVHSSSPIVYFCF